MANDHIDVVRKSVVEMIGPLYALGNKRNRGLYCRYKKWANKTSGIVNRRRNVILANQDVLEQIRLGARPRELILSLIHEPYRDGTV